MMAGMLAQGWNRMRHSAVFFGALGTLVRIGANLLLLPLLLEKLTTAELALWWVFVALGALANLADFGFGQAVSRVYSYLWAGADDFETEGLPPLTTADPNFERIHQFTESVRQLYTGLGLIAVLLLVSIGTFFVAPSAEQGGDNLVFWTVWAAYIGALAFNLGSSYWGQVCQGINRVKELQAAFLWSGLAFLGAASVLLLLGWGLAAMVIATWLRAWVARWLCVRACRAVLPPPAARPRPDSRMLKKLWPNAWKLGVVSVAVYLVYNGTLLISRHFLDDAVTASFGLTFQVGVFLVNFSALWLNVKWPAITMLRAQGRLVEMSEMFARRLGWTMVTFLFLAALMVLLGNRFLEWRDTNTRFLPALYAVVYLGYLGQQLFSAQFVTLTYTENVVPFYRIALATGIGLVVLSVYATPRYGLWGLIVSPIIAALACTAWYPVWRGFQGQPLTVGQFARAMILGKSGVEEKGR